MNIRAALILIIALSFSCFIFTPTTFAQSGFDFSALGVLSQTSQIPQFGSVAPGVGGLFVGLSLISTPNYPGPNEEFDVELSAPSEDHSGSVIKWYVNGVEDLASQNKRKNTFTASDLGEKMTIKAVLSKKSGGTDQTSLVIVPLKVDIILESSNIVPDFYAGRSLPSKGTNARATAVVHTGKTINRDNLIYRWEIDGNVLENGAIRGLSSVNFDMPLGQSPYLKVTISDSNGVIGSKDMQITPAQPEILFYEENPLLGVSQSALANNKNIIGNQVTLRAEPFYIAPFANKPNYLVEWSLAGRKVDNSGMDNPNVITFGSDGSTSRGNVSIRMADMSKLSGPISNSVFLTFGF